ncbi:DUF1440 domain-containing protein [bacterium]|nr:MAG: DUF1440 domain-containing protein [bacterium]
MNSATRNLLAGGAAGLLATIPMTLFMRLAKRALPRHERHPLPPRTVTKNVARAAGAPIDNLPDAYQAGTSLAAHLAFGAGAGAVYGAVAERTDLDPAVEGMGFGLLVWASAYLGILPAAGLLPSAKDHPPRRTALMIAAHLVYGAALGHLARTLRR